MHPVDDAGRDGNLHGGAGICAVYFDPFAVESLDHTWTGGAVAGQCAAAHVDAQV